MYLHTGDAGQYVYKKARDVVVLVRVPSTNQRRETPQTTKPVTAAAAVAVAASGRSSEQKKKHQTKKKVAPMFVPVRAHTNVHPSPIHHLDSIRHRKRRGQKLPHDLPPTYLITYLPVASGVKQQAANETHPTKPSPAQQAKRYSERTRTSTTVVILPAGYSSCRKKTAPPPPLHTHTYDTD